ncbi:unnamed protein product [Linum trigynum]|uniref:RNase H type-1 domain-containing protein n=1 Tax=Linum trigynum TaxID=586398 RepID=A0AAV2CX85_9ROSI
MLNEGGTGLGVVARDWNGNFVMTAVRRERRSWTPELAELRAIEFGLEMAREEGYRRCAGGIGLSKCHSQATKAGVFETGDRCACEGDSRSGGSAQFG